MKIKSPLLSNDLPFRPTILLDPLLEVAFNQINKGGHPVGAIAFCISQVVESHVNFNLEPNLDVLGKNWNTTKHDLKMFKLGYKYAVDTALTSVLCLNMSESGRKLFLTKLFSRSEDPLVLGIQSSISKNLKATINLLKLDTSAALLFKFLEDYSFSHHDYFLAGMEIAQIIFSGLAQEITKDATEVTWLTAPLNIPSYLTQYPSL